MPPKQSITEELLNIPQEIISFYFPEEIESPYNIAVDNFAEKVDSYTDEFLEMQIPFSGQFVWDNFSTLCKCLPEFMCSFVYIGRLTEDDWIPFIQSNAMDLTPDWNACSFDTIEAAEHLFESVSEYLLLRIASPNQRQSLHKELSPRIERFKPTTLIKDIRGIYGMLYIELKTVMGILYPKKKRAWYLGSHFWENLDLWLGLRPYHFPTLRPLPRLSSGNYFNGDYKRSAEDNLENLRKQNIGLNEWREGNLLIPPGKQSPLKTVPYISNELQTPVIQSTYQITQPPRVESSIVEHHPIYNQYTQIELIKRPVSGDSSGGKKHKNAIIIQQTGGEILREYISDNHFSLLYLLAILPQLREEGQALERNEIPLELVQTLIASLGYHIGYTWTTNTAQLSTVISEINRRFPNLITVNDNEQTGKREYSLNVRDIVPVPIKEPTTE